MSQLRHQTHTRQPGTYFVGDSKDLFSNACCHKYDEETSSFGEDPVYVCIVGQVASEVKWTLQDILFVGPEMRIDVCRRYCLLDFLICP